MMWQGILVHDIASNLDGAANRRHKQTDIIVKDFAKVPLRSLLFIMGYEDPLISGSAHGCLDVFNA